MAKAPDFLVHNEGDSVGVAVRNLTPGTANGGYLNAPGDVQVELTEPVSLGHKIALTDIADGADVIEYGVRVAHASSAIKRGQHVHVHNVRSARWQHSVA